MPNHSGNGGGDNSNTSCNSDIGVPYSRSNLLAKIYLISETMPRRSPERISSIFTALSSDHMIQSAWRIKSYLSPHYLRPSFNLLLVLAKFYIIVVHQRKERPPKTTILLDEEGSGVFLRVKPDAKCPDLRMVLCRRIQNFNIILAIFYVTFSGNHSIK